MKILFIVYAVGYLLMQPIAIFVCCKINKAENNYDEMVMSDSGDYYDFNNKPNILGVMLIMIISGAFWPFMVVALPGLWFFDLLARKFPQLMGNFFRDDDEIDPDEDEYL